MPNCSIKWCGNDSRKHNYQTDNITFHKFPKDPNLKEQWIKVTRRENWSPSKYSVVCSRHFTEDKYYVTPYRRHLRDNAVPTLQLPLLDTIPFRPPVTTTSNRLTTTEDTDENELSPASDNYEEEETDKIELSVEVTDNSSLNCTNKPTVTTKENHGKPWHEGFQCDNCSSDIIGFRYTCIQCNNFDLCAACESAGAHSRHYMLRVPSPRPYDEIQAVLVSIRKFLTGKLDFISTIEMDGADNLVSVKTELNSDDMGEAIEGIEEKVESFDECISNHELIEQTTLFSDGFSDLVSQNEVIQQQPKILNEDKETEGTFLVPILESTKSEIAPMKLEIKREDTKPRSLIEISTQQGQIIISSTAKRKIETNRSDPVDLEQSNHIGNKICVLSNTNVQELSQSSVILVRKFDTVSPLVKLLNEPPRSTSNTQNPTATSQLTNTSSRQKPKTINVDRKS